MSDELNIVDLPALKIELTGMVTYSNLTEFKNAALVAIDSINTSPSTDEEFSATESMIKWAGETEKKIESAKQLALTQTASIAELFDALDSVRSAIRDKRLAAEKVVKLQKETIIKQKLSSVTQKFNEFVASLKLTPINPPDFQAAIKGLKTIVSIDTKLEAALYNGKQEAMNILKEKNECLALLEGVADEYKHLFQDVNVQNMRPDVFELQIKIKISDEQKRQQAIAERAAKEAIEAERKAIADREANTTLPLSSTSTFSKVETTAVQHISTASINAKNPNALEEINKFLTLANYKNKAEIKGILIEFMNYVDNKIAWF